MTLSSTRPLLRALHIVLVDCGERDLATLVDSAASGTDDEQMEFLRSNELWGGAGSIADQAGSGQGREKARKIEAALIVLGQEQLRIGVLNARTESWVQIFVEWQKQRL